MSAVLYLSDNSWVIKRGKDGAPITDDTGTVPANGTLTARCYLSASKAYDATPIHATLDVSGVAITDGKLRTVLSGTNVRTQVEPLLAAAETQDRKLIIYEHVIVAGSHHDVKELIVERERMAA